MSRFLMALAVALAACSSQTPPTNVSDASVASDSAVARCAVRFDGDPAILLRTSERRSLHMVLDPPTPGVTIRVGVVGVGLDASLTDVHPVTAADGSAETELTAPTDSATFRVRATAECGAEASVEVAVGDRGFGSIAAHTIYQGARSPARLDVNIATGSMCPDAATDPAQRATVALPGGVVRFGSLPADLTFTVWAQALGDDDVVLAQGCAAPQTVRADQESAATVVFVDRPMRFADQYSLNLSLDLAATTTDLPARWTAPVRRELLTAGSTGAYIIREVSRAVADASGVPDGGTSPLQIAFDAAVYAGLGARFDAELTSRGLLLEDTFEQMATATSDALATVHWQLTFAANAADAPATPTSSVVTLDPGTPDVARDDARVTLAPDGTIALALDGDIATVALRDVSLPWTQVARGALGAVAGRLGASTTGEVAAAPLCPVAATMLRDASGICDAACIQTACRRAVDSLARIFDDTVASQLAERSTSSFRMAAVATPLARSLVFNHAQGTFVGQWTTDPVVSLGGGWMLQHIAPMPR